MYWKGKSGQHLVLVSDPEKGESVFAFDNPGFKEGPSILQTGEKENQTKVKWTQFNAVIPNNHANKIKSMDDTYITSPPLTKVPLRSHDFTGLGFNICGNMRDGIFVRDMLHRGPASESGRIMPGDRIDSVKISLRHMVFEDALTILSYASPYEVEMFIESRNASNTSSLLRTPPPPHKISHPLFRSQSIADLQKIRKLGGRRGGEQPSSLMSDISNSETKFPTLDRKPKSLDRTQVTNNCINESMQKHENIFHEVELTKVEIDEVDQKKETVSPNNVKSILVKGIQNLKEKLHNSLHQDDSKEEIKGGTIVNVSAQNTLEKKKPYDEGFQTVDLTVPSVPEEVERAGISARNNRKSVIEEDFDLSDNDDPVAAKRNKRKAPKPPQSPIEDEASINNHSLESVDSDSENGDKKSGTTIELNSSHITVHHVPESENRKASSLGDLSRYEAENIILLERAVSLDLGDGAPGTKKRKAPMPPQETCPFKEARIETGTGTLKKSSVWGTLEDVIQNGSDSSDADLGISGCSTPEKNELITSTPFKFSKSILNDENGISNIEVNNYKWDLSVPETSDFITALNGDETPPELPKSPMPTMSTFITEIQVTSLKPHEETEVIHLDNTQQLFDHMNSHQLDFESLQDEERTVSPKESPERPITPDLKTEKSKIIPTENTIKEIINEEQLQKSPPIQKMEMVKPSRSGVTVTNIKTSPSRIPVRAGPRSPGSGTSRSITNRNGHSSP